MAYTGKRIYNSFTGQQVVFLQTALDSGGHILTMQMSYQGIGPEPPVHFHPHQEEIFTVKRGMLSIRLNDKVEQFPAGSLIHIPRNTPHAMWNGQEGETLVTWEVRPALHTEYFIENVFGLSNNLRTNRKAVIGFLQELAFAKHFSREFRLQRLPYGLIQLLFYFFRPLMRLLNIRPVYKELID